MSISLSVRRELRRSCAFARAREHVLSLVQAGLAPAIGTEAIEGLEFAYANPWLRLKLSPIVRWASAQLGRKGVEDTRRYR